MMSRKDYEIVADVIRGEVDEIQLGNDPHAAPYMMVELRIVVSKLTVMFAEANPRFNRERFLRECGMAWES